MEHAAILAAISYRNESVSHEALAMCTESLQASMLHPDGEAKRKQLYIWLTSPRRLSGIAHCSWKLNHTTGLCDMIWVFETALLIQLDTSVKSFWNTTSKNWRMFWRRLEVSWVDAMHQGKKFRPQYNPWLWPWIIGGQVGTLCIHWRKRPTVQKGHRGIQWSLKPSTISIYVSRQSTLASLLTCHPQFELDMHWFLVPSIVGVLDTLN